MKGDLIIPVYVDTNALLDLLASIEGGFSIVEKVTSRSTGASGIDREVKAETGTEFGIPNVLSLLKLNIGYSANWKKTKEQQDEKEAERYHTYGSLFYRLRDYLDENSLIKQLDDSHANWESVQPSDFVEVRGIFRPNPFANWLEIVNRLIGMVLLFINVSSSKMPHDISREKMTPEDRQMQKEIRKQEEEEKEQAREQRANMEKMREFLRGILSDIQSENIRTFVVELSQLKEHKAVVFLFLDYLRDRTMTEIRQKEYRVLGKVVRKIEKDNKESIDLLSGTAMGGMGKDAIIQLVTALNKSSNMNLPEIQTEIFGPALEIVPIAIFV